jgi:p-hydroxybenzoate 3-monooxygenase
VRTKVAIVGAGPAGLTLAKLLDLQGVDCVVLEQRSRDYIEQRTRAGILEQPTVDLMAEVGLADRIRAEGIKHDGFYVTFDEATHHLDFNALVGGHATVYAQQELVKDLVSDRLANGLPLLFEADVTAIDNRIDGASVTVRHEGRTFDVEADFVACCDGYHGVGRAAIPAESRREIEQTYPVAWLGILARTTPVTPEGMYCAHENGLSVHSMRGARITRQYLQVPADTDLADWSDTRIWDELAVRSAGASADGLERGEIFDRSLAPLRSYVNETMQHRRVFLLGDAAHIVPPTGAKGLNLAVSDATVLAHGLAAYYLGSERRWLDDYSATALPRIWQAQLFSATLTTTLHRLTEDPLQWRLNRARLHSWVTSEAQRRALGEVYLGLPFPVGWQYAAS